MSSVETTLHRRHPEISLKLLIGQGVGDFCQEKIEDWYGKSYLSLDRNNPSPEKALHKVIFSSAVSVAILKNGFIYLREGYKVRKKKCRKFCIRGLIFWFDFLKNVSKK